MNKILKITLIVLVVIIILGVLAIILDPVISHSDCYLNGGKWRAFTNGCVDSCDYARGNHLCTSAITPGCDCGPDKCWNGTNCEMN